MIAANEAVDYSQSAPSLGLVKVLDVRVTVADGEPWEPRQLDKTIRAAQPDLFNPDGFKELQPAPFQVKLKYRCEAPGCAGHEPKMLDWETGQAGRKWLREHDSDQAKRMLRNKYESFFSEDKDAHLYVGNLHRYRSSFSVLGVWSPKLEPPDPYDGDLFS